MRVQLNNAVERFLRMPEVVLDVLKFLNYYQNCKMEVTSMRFWSVVDRYRGELALCQFYQIQLVPEPAVSLTAYRRAIEITEDFYGQNQSSEEALVDEKIENEDWAQLLVQKPPLYAFPDISFGSPIHHDGIDSFLLFIAKDEDDGRAKLCLELPLYSETVDDLSLTQFWLHQLSRVHFRWMDFGRFFFNPDLVGALLPSSNSSPSSFLYTPSFLLHCHHLSLKMGVPDEQHNERFLRFAFTYFIAHCLTLRCGLYFEGILELLLKCGHRIGSIVIPVGPIHSTVELQNLIIHHAENALNPLAMVGFIDFRNVDDFPWPDLRSSKCLGRTVDNDLTHSKYLLSNVHLRNVHFTITIGHLHGTNEFKRFSIQRTVDKPKTNAI